MSSPYTYTESFYQAFPQYLAIGMTYEQYWDMDCTLVVAYRKAEEIRNNKRNQELWLQGMYIYEALCDVAPIMRSFAKKGTKPHDYPHEPYSLNAKQKEEHEQRNERKTYEKGLRMMEAFMKLNNKRIEQEVSDNGNNC